MCDSKNLLILDFRLAFFLKLFCFQSVNPMLESRKPLRVFCKTDFHSNEYPVETSIIFQNVDKKRVEKKTFSVSCPCCDRDWFNRLKKRSYAEHELIFQAKCRHFGQNDRSFDRIFVWMKVGFAKTRSGLRLSNIGLTLWKQKSFKKMLAWNPK